ncbi:MAG: PEGA domain-containing protein [Myxococcota bacterium]
MAPTRAAQALDDAPSDEAASEARRAEAKSKYQAGVEAYEKRRYKDAVDLFLAADRLAPSAPLSFNIGRAYERLGDDSSALRWYRDYLRRSSGAQNADAVRELVGKLAESLAKKGVQQVSVFSTPAGATVSVDEQPMGVTPWTGDLPPGKHHVLLSLRGYADTERDFELTANEPLDLNLRLDVAKAPEPSASSAPPGAAPIAPTTVPGVTTAPAPAHQEPSRGLGVWPWVTLGVGAAALGGAFTFEMLRRSAEDDAKNDDTQLGFQSAVDSMESRKTTARVLLGVGSAIVITGGVLVFIDASSRSNRTQVGFSCLPGACGFSAKGRF